MTKFTLLMIIFAPIAAIILGLIALYYAFRINEDTFGGEIDFGPVDF